MSESLVLIFEAHVLSNELSDVVLVDLLDVGHGHSICSLPYIRHGCHWHNHGLNLHQQKDLFLGGV